MQPEDFYFDHLKPTLQRLSKIRVGYNAPSARKILFMTAAHESGRFQHRRQVGGPALSFYQIEPDTLDDLYDNYLSFRPKLQHQLDSFRQDSESRLKALEFNNAYATCAARFNYARIPEALPPIEDTQAFARYAKRHWNTDLGAATAEKYMEDYTACVTERLKQDWGEASDQ